MSFRAMTWALNVRTGSPTRKLILLLLADRSNDEGMCFPSLHTIADDCEIKDVSTIKRNIKVLEDRGIVRVERRKQDGVNLPNVYTLCLGSKPSLSADQGVGAQSPDGGGSDTGGVGAQSPTNQSLEPVKEPENSKKDTDINQLVTYQGSQITQKEAAERLDSFLCRRIEGVLDRRPLCKPQANRKAFTRLLKGGVPVEVLIDAIKMLTDPQYVTEEYHIVAMSGRAIYDKWDKIEAALSRRKPTKERVKISGDFVVFVEREKIGDNFPRRRLDQCAMAKYEVIA